MFLWLCPKFIRSDSWNKHHNLDICETSILMMKTTVSENDRTTIVFCSMMNSQ